MSEFSALADKEVRLVRVVAAAVLGQWQRLAHLRQAAPPGEPDREWREAVLQTHIFAGFPRLVEAYEALEQAGGLGTPAPDELRAEPDMEERGAELFERIYTDQASSVRARIASFHPDFARWIAGHAYGRVLTRPGLDAARREICAVAALVALGQDRQLASHARGAVRCGASPEAVAEIVPALGEHVRPERAARARTVLARFARMG